MRLRPEADPRLPPASAPPLTRNALAHPQPLLRAAGPPAAAYPGERGSRQAQRSHGPAEPGAFFHFFCL